MGKTRFPSFFRNLTGILASVFLAAAAFAAGESPAEQGPGWVETGVDRPGFDFKILWLRGGPEPCQEACAQNPLCRSYTYVRAGAEGRIEGCWLKDGVPPAVQDNCCISGVKTGETVSRFLSDTAIPVSPTSGTPTVPPEEEAALVPARRVRKVESVPETGSGKRMIGGMHYASVPPAIAESAASAFSPAASAPAAEAGTGRRRAEGMHYSAVPPPPGTAGRGPESEGAAVPVAFTGKRTIPGLHYSALPPKGKSVSGNLSTGSARKRVGGVDITAVPPQ